MAAEHVVLIGQRIAQAREEKGWTQRELAEKIPGKSDGNQVSKWERGKNRVSDDTLAHIARLLDKDVPWFMAPEPDKTKTPDPFSNGSGDVAARLAAVEERLAALDAKLDRVLGYPAEPPEPATVEQLVDSARAMLSTIEQINGKLGQRLGKRDLRSRSARGRPPGSREDAA